MAPPRLLLVGGGHAHLLVLEELAQNRKVDLEVTVVADRQGAVYSGMVPGLVAGSYRPSQLTVDLEALCRRSRAHFVEARVDRVDASNRRLHLHDGSTLEYDLASLNIGSTVAGLDLPGVRQYAVSTRPIADLVARLAPETLERDARPAEILVVGGGAGGVELAFCLAARPVDRPRRVRVVTAAAQLLSPRRSRLAQRVARLASRRGIDLLYDTEVTSVAEGLASTRDGSALPFDLLVWATGAASFPLARDSGLPADARGFLLVEDTLQVVDHPNLFAAGDCATLRNSPQTPKAGVYAVRQGPVLAGNLQALVSGKPLRRYTPQNDFLTLLNLGDGRAVGARFGMTFAGRWVLWLKDRIDRRFVERFPPFDPTVPPRTSSSSTPP